MQTYQVLKRKFRGTSEIEYFLFILEMEQAIEFAFLRVRSFIYRQYDLNLSKEAEDEKYRVIRELTKFGLSSPIFQTRGFGEPPKSLEYQQWFNWWESYLDSLNEVELGDLEKARINGESLSEWYPEGTWKK